MRLRITENRLRGIIKECVKGILLESSGEINITNDLRSYIKMANMGEMGDADMSKRACELHERLMEYMDLYHFEPEDREMFAQVLSFFSKLLKLNTEVAIYADGSNTVKYKIGDAKFPESFNVNDGTDKYDAIIYKSFKGAIVDNVEWDDYGGDDPYNSNMIILKAHLDDSTINDIRGMGLIPALCITGSFHEQFVYAVGILPSEAHKFDEDNGIYFKCVYNYDENEKN